MPTLALACGFLIGVTVGVWRGWPWEAALVVAPLAALAGLWLRDQRLRLLALAAIALAGGLLRVALPSPDPGTKALGDAAGRQVILEGVVAAPPEAAGQAQRLTLAARTASGPAATGAVTVVTALYPAYRFGDRVRATGVLKEEQWRGGQRLVLRYPRLAILGHGQGGLWRQPLEDLRARLADSLARALPEPQAGLAQGIFLGLRSNLPPELTAAFRATGTSHLVTISGQNITIVVGLVSGALLWLLGRRWALLTLLACVWAYAALAGAEPPVVRATVMASAYLLGSALGRQTSGLVALALALAAMVGVQPQVLADVSFQLSAGAMVGLVLLAPRLQAAWSRWTTPAGPPGRGIRAGLAAWLGQNLAVSVAAVALTWPIIARTFHSFSWVGVPATLAGLPALPFIIATSAVTATAGLLSGPLATALGWVSWLPLTYLVQVVELFARVPGAGLQVEAPARAAMAGYYLALGGALWLWSRRPLPVVRVTPDLWGGAAPRWRWGLGGLATGAALAWAMALTAPGGELVVRALPVPSGHAILVEAPGRVRALVDGGPSPEALELALARALPFWDRHLDLLVSTRSEPAYLAGQVAVSSRHRPRRALYASAGAGALHREWRRGLADAGVPAEPASPGTAVRLGPRVTVEVIELEQAAGAQRHAGLLISYGAARILVMGALSGGGTLSAAGQPPQAVFVTSASAAGAALRDLGAQVIVVSGAYKGAEDQGPRRAPGGPVTLGTEGRREIVLRTDGRRLLLKQAPEGQRVAPPARTPPPSPSPRGVW
ncbi:MAG: ComEC/Rec2 family competence protein [Chloroflexi bacterium]|nr:ComEC/Rec2 family competence protein [Chloroflexota bacterium]